MNSTFEDRLLDELKRHRSFTEAEAQLAAARHRRLITPRRTGIGLVAAAIAASAFVVLPGGGGTPAYAVEQGANGGVVVHISDWPHGEEAVAEFSSLLEDAGVETLYNPPEGYLCQPREEPAPGSGDDQAMTFLESGTDGGERSLDEGGGEGSHSPAEPPEDVEVHGHVSFVGGATMIGPEVAQSVAGGGGATDPLLGPDSLQGRSGDGFTYHLSRGDTVILSDRDGAESIAFVEGPCQPVAG